MAAKPVHLIHAPASITALSWRPLLDGGVATVTTPVANRIRQAESRNLIASAAATAGGAAVRIWDVVRPYIPRSGAFVFHDMKI